MATVTIQDTEDPNAICQNAVVVLDASGNGTLSAASINNGSTDNCSVFSVSVSPNSFTCANVGNNTVTLTVADPSGNDDTCMATVDVQDNTLPTANCQDITISLDVNGAYTLSNADAVNINNGSTDACGIDNVSVPATTFGCGDIGGNLVTLTVEDNNGNTNTCNATVTVEDNAQPIINNCPPASVVMGTDTIRTAAGEGNCFATVGFLSPTASDACSGIGSFTGTAVDESMNPVTLNSSASPGVGCTPVSLFAGEFDVSNWALINVLTGDAPNSVTLAGAGGSSMSITIPADYNGVISFDWVKFGGGAFLFSLDGGATAELINFAGTDNGTQEIVVEAGDQLVITRTGPPAIISDFSFTCAEGTSGNFPVGVNTVTYTAIDGAGNDSICVFYVEVLDQEKPALTPILDQTINLSTLDCSAPVVPDLSGLVITSDNCGFGAMSITQSPAAGSAITSVSDGSNFTISMTSTDVNGNDSTVMFMATINDNVAPTINTCPSAIAVQIPDDGLGSTCNAGAMWATPTFDDCGDGVTGAAGVFISRSDMLGEMDSFSVANSPVTVIYRYTDAGGNSEDCSFTLTALDNEGPEFTSAPSDMTIEASTGCVGVASWSATAIDCSSPVNITGTHTSGANFPVGTTTVTLTATDNVGNTRTTSFDVTVQDTTDPVQTGGQADGSTINVNASGGGCTATVSWTAPTFSDVCGATVVSTNNPGDTFSGTTTVTYTATDPSGNSTTVSFTVNVNDGSAPIAGCQPNPINLTLGATGSATPGTVTLTALDVNLGSTDNCGTPTLTISENGTDFFSSLTFDCNDLTFGGSNTITLAATDGTATSTCTATVTITDGETPDAECQNFTLNLGTDGTGTISVSDLDNGSSDNSSCLTLFLNRTDFDCADVGVNFVQLTARDAQGLTDACFSQVTVVDNTDPVLFNIPADATIECDSTLSPPVIDFTCTTCTADPMSTDQDTVTATDACGITDIIFNVSSTQSSDLNSCNAYSYTMTRTWTAIDDNNNQVVGTQVVDVVDTEAPTGITFSSNIPANDTIGTDPTTCTATVSLAIDPSDAYDCAAFANLTITNFSVYANSNGADASGNYPRGFHSVTFRAEDPCGNVSFWTESFWVVDDVAPTASCAGSLNLGLPSSGILIVNPTAINNNSFDNCDFISPSPFNTFNFTVSPDTLRCEDVGTSTLVTLTVRDNAGNSSACTTTINLQENNGPTVIGQNITVTLGDGNTVSITPEDVDGGSFDDCTDITLSISQSTFTDADLGSNNITLTAMDENGNTSNTTVVVTVILPPTCFDIPSDLSGGAGDIVNIPITAEDFTSLVGFQFELELDDADVGEFVGISGVDPALNNVIFGEPVLTDSTITSIDTTFVPDVMGMDSIGSIDTTYMQLFDAIGITWAQANSDPMTGDLIPLTFDTSDVLFYIDLMLTGDIGDNSDIMINPVSSTTPPEVVFGFGNTLYDVAFVPCSTSPGFIQIGQLVFSGQVYTENADPVALVEVTLDDQTTLTGPGNESDTTEVDGLYSLTTTGVDLFRIEPQKDINWPNGIDILDVGLIQRHTVGNPYVGSAYKKIAADVSGNGDITTFDAVLLNAFLASFFDPTATPPTESWQFVDAKQMLANDPNAFVPGFRNYIELPNITSDSMDNDFIAIKTGDLGGLSTADVTALTTGGGSASLDRADNTLKFMISDRSIKEGESVQLDVTAEQFEELMAYQWILKFNPQQLRYVGASDTQRGTFTFSEALIEDGQLILTWFAADDITLSEKDVVFSLEFEALENASSLNDVFEVATYEQFKAVAYQGDETAMDVELIITEAKPVTSEFVLNQNIPNPFKDETVISFYLPESGAATLSIMDVTGRLLKVYEGEFSEGYNEIGVNRSDLPQAGTLFYELRTADHTASKKMIIID